MYLKILTFTEGTPCLYSTWDEAIKRIHKVIFLHDQQDYIKKCKKQFFQRCYYCFASQLYKHNQAQYEELNDMINFGIVFKHPKTQ